MFWKYGRPSAQKVLLTCQERSEAKVAYWLGCAVCSAEICVKYEAVVWAGGLSETWKS